MRTSLRVAVAAAASCVMAAAATAQSRIWVVDAAGGPGSDFLSIAAAVDAAAPGDRITVRPGSYTGFAMSKPLSIVGGPGVQLTPGGSSYLGLVMSGIPAGARVLVRGIAVQTIPLGSAVIVQGCAGTVLLEEISCNGVAPVAVRRSADVRLSSCTVPGIHFEASTGVVDRCTVHAGVATPGALIVDRSTVVVSRSELVGGAEFGPLAPGPAVAATAGDLIVTGDGSGRLAAGTGLTPVSAIAGTGTLLLDAHVVLAPSGSAPPVGAGIAVTTRPIPSLRADGGPIGGVARAELFAAAGHSYVLVVGLPGPPVALPGLLGSLWLRAAVVAAYGTVPATGRAAVSVPVPNHTVLFGVAFTWQGAAGEATSGTAVSNPATYVHGM